MERETGVGIKPDWWTIVLSTRIQRFFLLKYKLEFFLESFREPKTEEVHQVLKKFVDHALFSTSRDIENINSGEEKRVLKRDFDRYSQNFQEFLSLMGQGKRSEAIETMKNSFQKQKVNQPLS